jgi:hypothetical protein
VLRVETLRTPLARLASDHLPLLVEIRLAPPGATPGSTPALGPAD